MNSYTGLYWLTRLDGINNLFIALHIVAIITIIVIYAVCAINSEYDEFKKPEEVEKRIKKRKNIRSNVKWLAPLAIISIIISVLLPSQKEAVFIIAGGKTIDFIQSDTSIQKIPSQTTQIVSDFLDKQIKDINKKPE